MDDVGAVDVFEATQQLVEEETHVLVREVLRRVDDAVEIALHQVQHDVDVLEKNRMEWNRTAQHCKLQFSTSQRLMLKRKHGVSIENRSGHHFSVHRFLAFTKENGCHTTQNRPMSSP